MRIITTYKSNANGTGQILAKGHGKQFTMPYDQQRSPYWNHGAAAGLFFHAKAPSILADPASIPDVVARIRAGHGEHIDNGDGKHTFIL